MSKGMSIGPMEIGAKVNFDIDGIIGRAETVIYDLGDCPDYDDRITWLARDFRRLRHDVWELDNLLRRALPAA